MSKGKWKGAWPLSNTHRREASQTTVNGSGGADRLIIDDRANSVLSTYAISSTQVAFNKDAIPGGVTYFNIPSLTLNSGSGGNTINVHSTAPGVVTTINVDTGANDVRVTPDSHSLDLLRGALTINGNGTTTLRVDDRSSFALGNQYILTDGQMRLNRFRGGAPTFAQINYTNLANLTLADAIPTGENLLQVLSTGGTNLMTLDTTGSVAHIVVGDATANLDGIGNVRILGSSTTFVTLDDVATADPISPAFPGFRPRPTFLLTDGNVRRTNVSSYIIPGSPALFQNTYVASIDYNNIARLVINAGSSNDVVNVLSTAAGTTTLIDSGRGNDVFQIGDNRKLSGINGPLHLQSATAFSGADLFLDDSNELAPKSQVVLDDGSVTGLAPAPISWTPSATGDGGITGVYVLGGRGGNVFTVENSSLLYHFTYLVPGVASNRVNVHGMQGNLYVASVFGAEDVVTVGSLANNLDGLRGLLTVNGNNSTVLNIHDQGATAGKTYIVTEGEFTRGPLEQHAVITERIAYSGLGSLVARGGLGANVFFVNSTPLGTAVSLYGGTADVGSSVFNEFVVGGFSNLDAIQGPLALHGQNSLSYPFLTDQQSTVGHTYTLTADRVRRAGMADITFDGMVQMILFTSITQADTVNVESVATNVFTPIALGSGDRITLGRPLESGGRTLQDIHGTVRPQLYGNGPVEVVVDNSGDTTPRQATFTYDPANPGSGHVLSGLTTVPIWFILDATSSLLVKGGIGDDSFQLPASLPTVPLTLDGGDGTNTLDYSAFTTSVMVNLQAGTATAASGGIANFANVRGGAGDDVLIGNTATNLLWGGPGNDLLLGGSGNDRLFGDSGRDLLIGGVGSDLLEGGLGDDILIGGYTLFDTRVNSDGVAQFNIDLAALNAVMAAWTSTDSYNVRFGAIKTGVGPNSQYRLDPTTVHDDADDDELTGGDGQDWFFIPKIGDIITDLNFNPSEPENKKEKTSNIK